MSHKLPVSASPVQHTLINYCRNLVLFTGALFAITSVSAQSWPIIANEQQVASSTTSYTTIASASEGSEGTLTVPYVAYVEANIAKVKKFSNSAWEQVGNNVSTGNATFTRINIDGNNKIYVSYVDAANGNKLAVKFYDTATQTWEPLANNAANLYVSAASITNSISQYSSTPRSMMVFDENEVPFIVFADGAGLSPIVKKFNGTSWVIVGSGYLSTERAIGVGIAIDSATNLPWVVYINQPSTTSSTGNLKLFQLNGTTWDSLPVPPVILGGGGTTSSGATVNIRHSSIAFNSTWNIVLTYFNTGNANRSTAVVYNKTLATWALSGVLSTRDASNNALYRDRTGNLYNSYTDAYANGSGRSVARVMKMNADGTGWYELRNPPIVDGIDEPVGNVNVTVAEDTSKPYIVYTKTNSSSVVTPVVRRFNAAPPPPPPPPAPDVIVTTPRQMEKLTRSLVAIRTGSTVYVGWRMLGTDSTAVQFNLYRDGILLNTTPLTSSTNYVDNTLINGTYTIKAIINGNEQPTGESTSAIWAQNYLNIPLQVPIPGVTPANEAYTYNANDASVGDVDGDGEFEIILKWDPSNSKDNSQSGYTGNVFIDCYKLNGTRLWRIDLGKNIRAGAHYTQFLVYDFDGDGKAELACKTADGTIDGVGAVIGNASIDYRTVNGYILSGPEFLTVFNGLTGAAMATANYLPARGTVSSWGDSYGNRVDRFIAAVAYLDGARPSMVFGRGYYTRLVRAAWDFRNGQLTSRWVFDSNTAGNASYAGQGNHQMTVGDVDGDGKDEVFNGSSGVNDNGTGLWANGMGHGDALHMSDIDPDRPGLELWQPYEDPANNGLIGAALLDGKTGARLFTVPLTTASDVGRGLSANIDPRYKGNEIWAARGDLYTAKGVSLSTTKPSMNFAIWWDADSTRELLDGNTITKWNYLNNTNPGIFTATNCSSNNSTKSNPCLTADLFGDWREEVMFRTSDNLNLRIYSTTSVASSRFYTLMHDPQYRVAVAWQNAAYNQPPHPGYYLGEGMAPLVAPRIYLAPNQPLPVTLLAFNATRQGFKVALEWRTANEKNSHSYTIERSADGVHFTAIYSTRGAGTTTLQKAYQAVDDNPVKGLNYYRLKQTDADGSFTYSVTRVIHFLGEATVLVVAPNPVTNVVKVQFSSRSAGLQFVLSSVDSKVIMQGKGSITQINQQLNGRLTNLKPGVYFVQLFDGVERYIGKMIKK